MSAKRDSRSGALNLEQQRKRAKDLVREQRQGSPQAAERIVRHLPRASSSSLSEVLARRFSLTEAQLVVAREAGFPSWPRLKRELELARLGVDARLEALIDAALGGNGADVRTAFAADSNAARRSLHVAASLGDPEAALALLDANPAAAVERGGGRNWTPLFYLCSARFERGEAKANGGRLRIASRLLELGADPNEEIQSYAGPGGFRSVLQAAAADVASEDLLSLLIAHHATLEPTGVAAGRVFPLSDAVAGGNPKCVQRVLEAKPPSWQAREALELALELDSLESTKLLLEYGAEPNAAGRWWGQRGSCLHAAILLGRGRELLEVLLDGGVDISVRDCDGRTAYQTAIRTRHAVAAELLERRGALRSQLDEVDRLIAACVGLERENMLRMLSAGTDFKSKFRRRDHQMVCWAIRKKRYAAVPLLLEAGLDPNVADNHGETPLHLAVKSGDTDTVAVLRACAAAADARNFFGQTPFEDALDPEEQRERDELFERAAHAVVDGNIEGLREMLDEQPDLVYARSPRAHRATLLHYVAANGTERQEVPPNAPAVADLLLERGAVADAECNMYGGGETTLGLTVSSVFPERAGLTGDIVRALVRGGAKIGGHDDNGDPLSGAIDGRSLLGVEALVEMGAVETMAAAAALGHWDVLGQRLELEPHLVAKALLVAAKFGRVAVIENLLARGVDVNSRPTGSVSALHEAAWWGEKRAVLCLLAHGADATLRDTTHGGTPAAWARHSGNMEIAEILETASNQRS